MGIRTWTILFACVLCNEATATQIIINFTGVQVRTPFYFQGGVNELDIHQGEPVHGSFILDLEGLVDQYPDDPMQLVANETVQRAQFQSVTAYAPLRGVGPYGGASAYAINVGSASIGIYANDLYQIPTGEFVSDIFELSLNLDPALLADDGYDLANLSVHELLGVGIGASNSGWAFRRAVNSFDLDYSLTVYEGYLTTLSISKVAEPSQALLAMTSLFAALSVGRRTARRRAGLKP